MKYKELLTNFFKRTIFAQVVLLTALIGVIYFFKLSFDFSNSPLRRSDSEASNAPNLATLAINFETEKRFFEGEVAKGMTMLDALNLAVSVGKIKLNYAIDVSGNVSVMEIDGYTNGVGNKYFVFYLNSKKVATEDLNKELVRGRDRIEIGFQ